MLKKIRVILAVLFFVAVTLLFLDFTGAIHHWLGWVAIIQFLPAVLAINLVVIIALLVLTILFGRIYCSVICPLGVFQDGVANLSKKGKKGKYSYSKELKWLRYGVFALFVIALIAGLNSLVALLAPYSAWGRIVQNFLAPVWQWGNNLFASIAEKHESYAFYTKEVWLKSLPTFIIAAVTLVAIVILAWKNGRTYCNTICPVGTTLSFFSRFAMFRPVIDASKCKSCHLCEHKCKAACIDIDGGKKIDYSRCVDCFNCIDNCKFDALHYRFAWGKTAGQPSEPGRVHPRSAAAEYGLSPEAAPEHNEASKAGLASPDRGRPRHARGRGPDRRGGSENLFSRTRRELGGAERSEESGQAEPVAATIKVSVTNEGPYDGAEVVQLYVRDEYASVTRPVKELKAFKRIFLKARESAEVTFSITPDMLQCFGADEKWSVEPGEFTIMIGSSSADEDLQSISLLVKE